MRLWAVTADAMETARAPTWASLPSSHACGVRGRPTALLRPSSWVDGCAYPTRAAARRAVFEWAEGWYNRRRLHSALGNRSPVEWEQGHGISTSHYTVVEQCA